MAQDRGILVFAGSTRADSLNRKLARNVVLAAAGVNVGVNLLELHDYPLPLYEGDLERTAGIPRHAVALRAQLRRHETWLIASPEYNSSISALLKNVIDWASRPFVGESELACFRNRTVALLSSSPRASGGARGLAHLRQILTHMGARVHDEDFVVSRGLEAFDENGVLRDPGVRVELQRFVVRATDAQQMPAVRSVA